MSLYNITLLFLFVTVYLNFPGRFFLFATGCLLIVLGNIPWITLDMLVH